nr:hypothetical protein [Alistipes sp.]
MIKSSKIICALAIASLFVGASVAQKPIKELASNEEYRELMLRSEELQTKEDSITLLINEARTEYHLFAQEGADSITAERDRFATYILDLEQQIFDLRSQRGQLTSRINSIEQEWVMAQLMNPVEEELVAELPDSTAEEVIEPAAPIYYRNLVENTIFRDILTGEDYNDLLIASEEDKEMETIVADYLATYADMAEAAEAYRNASEEAEAERILARFGDLEIEAEELSDEMQQRWNHIIDTKYYAYGYILEHERRYDLLDKASSDFSTMLQQCAANDGNYASDALMRYIVGRPTLLGHEIEFAREMELMEAADSLSGVRDNLNLADYRLEPIKVERRLFLDFAPIVVGRTNYYNSANPLPELRIFERGTIYRILLGTFRSKQPMTLFKGVQPLFIAENDDETYSYYAGGFATLAEAEEAQLFLKEKGFRAPEVCRWENGEMINLTEAEESGEEGETVDMPVVGMRYMVEIEAEMLTDEMRNTINQTTPGKMVSRADGRFVVGTFTSRSEADMLLTTLVDQFSDIQVTLREIELN